MPVLLLGRALPLCVCLAGVTEAGGGPMCVAGVDDGAIGPDVGLKKPRMSPDGKLILVSCCCVVCGRANWRLFQDSPRKCEESFLRRDKKINFFCEETNFFFLQFFFHEGSLEKKNVRKAKHYLKGCSRGAFFV
jgi:hypothetical protein